MELVRLLVERGADVNTKDTVSLSGSWWIDSRLISVYDSLQSGQTPLHDAARNDANVELVRLLIDRGADVNAKDSVRLKDNW